MKVDKPDTEDRPFGDLPESQQATWSDVPQFSKLLAIGACNDWSYVSFWNLNAWNFYKTAIDNSNSFPPLLLFSSSSIFKLEA